jgi:uncharacterized membrane protein YdjX (TVP38/TMEM64 family)
MTTDETPAREDAPAKTAPATRPKRLRLLAGAVAIAAGVVIVHRSGLSVAEALAWVDGLGFWGRFAFALIYATATVLFVPGVLLTLAGGALFGPVEGTIVVWLAAMLGSGAAFLVARYAARGFVQEQIARSPKFAAVDRAVAENGLKITFLLRLSPVFPFNLLNYALGLTRVPFRDYMLAGIGMIPGTLLYVYSGYVIGDVARIASGVRIERGAGWWAVTLLGLLATVAVTAIVTRIARRALGSVAEA